MHNERETAGMEYGTDQFGDNVHGKKRELSIRDSDAIIICGAPEKAWLMC